MRTKVIGAGSIGNHLSHAARTLGWSVDVVDIDAEARQRMRTSIYPGRYGAWDDAIRLFAPEEAPSGGYDLIAIGTPPDTHLPLAQMLLEERPRAMLVEKPICGPDLAGAQAVFDRAAALGVAMFVGYDHVVGAAAKRAMALAASTDAIGPVATLDVEFREHWGGIFAAHPWLDGPADSYLGFWQRGGGAAGEHSHAVNLWQAFAKALGHGRVVEVDARLSFVRDGQIDYDQLCAMHLATETGLVGRCVQDVVTQPPRKWACVQGAKGRVAWICGKEPGVDAVEGHSETLGVISERFEKTRPDDFLAELRHIESAIGDPASSPIVFDAGLETMLVVAAAHKSHALGRRMRIDYAAGWTPDAVLPA